MTAAPLRVACLGAGYFARFHYESWARIDGVALVGACDLDRGRAEATGLPAFTELGEMLSRVKPDLLDVIVPPAGHADAIRTALDAGVRRIVCQKPFCDGLRQAEEMVALADHHGATLIVHENFRFQPWYRSIKAALNAGRIGTVQQASFRLRPGDGQGPRAYMDRQPYFQTMPRFLVHETAVHLIDTFRYLLGAPRAVYADLRRLNPAIAGEDAGLIVLEHPGDVRALIDGNRHLDHDAENLRCTMGEALIEGTGGAITLCGDGSATLRPHGSRERERLLGPSTHDGFGGDCVHAFQSHVLRALRGETPLETAAVDYLTVLRIEEAVYRSAKSGARIALETE